MIANLSHAVDRTLTVFDQLGVMWGPGPRPVLSVHGLSHEQVHEMHRDGGVEDGPSAEYTVHPYIRVQFVTRLGWSVGFFGTPDLTCDRCRELIGLASEAVDAVQLAGVVDRMEGGGM
jgi:hypothetical protein